MELEAYEIWTGETKSTHFEFHNEIPSADDSTSQR